MLVIVKNLSTSSEETKVIAAGEEFESDLKDLLEYVLSTYTKKQRLTHCLNFQHSVRNHFRPQPDSSSESVAHSRFLKTEQGQG